MLVVGLVVAVIAADLFLGARLQLTGLWGNDPILGGRFSGLGNVGFAVLGTGAVMVAALMAECFDEPWVPAVTAWMFGLVVVVDGMPGLGSDVGGIIALVPGLTAAWFLIHGRRISIRAVLLTLVVGAAVLAAFTAFDLSRPPDEQTHLARLVDDAFSRGPEVVFDAAARKMRANIGVFGTTPASFLIPPIFGYFVWLVVRGGGSWPRLRATHPSFHRGLLGAAVVTILGFLVNDSGVIVVALSLAVLAPACVLMLDHVETSKRMDPT